jgi:hypothetical protein
MDGIESPSYAPATAPWRACRRKSARRPRQGQGKLDSTRSAGPARQADRLVPQERDRQSVNRMQMAVDEDFYDGLQWTEEDAAELIARGQAPLVFNKVKPTMNWMLGTEKRTRFDYKILPREESDVGGAEVKTKVFKYLSDATGCRSNAARPSRSRPARAWAGSRRASTPSPGRNHLRGRRELAQRAARQHGRRSWTMSDGRYLFRWRWLDLDVAEAMFPNRVGCLRSAAMNADEIAERDEDIWYLGARTNSDWRTSRFPPPRVASRRDHRLQPPPAREGHRGLVPGAHTQAR